MQQVARFSEAEREELRELEQARMEAEQRVQRFVGFLRRQHNAAPDAQVRLDGFYVQPVEVGDDADDAVE